jgi:hypothetical protein
MADEAYVDSTESALASMIRAALKFNSLTFPEFVKVCNLKCRPVKLDLFGLAVFDNEAEPPLPDQAAKVSERHFTTLLLRSSD